MTVSIDTIPERQLVPKEHQWNLAALFKSESEWEKTFKEVQKISEKILGYKGRLSDSAEALAEALDFKMKVEIQLERLNYYAFLRVSEDVSLSESQGRYNQCVQICSQVEAAYSFFIPEIQQISNNLMDEFLNKECLSSYAIYLKKILRFKPYVLTEKEEKILAMQAGFSGTSYKAFNALTETEIDFGHIETSDGNQKLTQSTYGIFRLSPDRNIRKQAYEKLYKGYETHQNTLASLYEGSVQKDVFDAKIRGFNSSIERRLFDDDVPIDVYKNLIETVKHNLGHLHKYYRLRQKVLGFKELKVYDLQVPLVSKVKMKHSYEEAVDVIVEALKPLGNEYTNTIRNGLLGSWVDRYENKGKRSGAFSAGSYKGDPYILMNYKEEVIDDVFTLIHEGGHSMHSWYSVSNNPFSHYNYTIFVAEVASTFNEQLLGHYLMKQHQNNTEIKAYLLNKQIDDIIGTLYRQTQFAEFEMASHEMIEQGIPLTVESLRRVYGEIQSKYLGDDVILEEYSSVECLRIPHFYSAFYVYKYATGIAAAIALSQKVLSGDDSDLDRYLGFLKSGGSAYPLEQLRRAGVDMGEKTPIQDALNQFGEKVTQLEELLL